MECNLRLWEADSLARNVHLHHREARQGILNTVASNAISYVKQGNMGLPDMTFQQRRVTCGPRRTGTKTGEERSKWTSGEAQTVVCSCSGKRPGCLELAICALLIIPLINYENQGKEYVDLMNIQMQTMIWFIFPSDFQSVPMTVASELYCGSKLRGSI